MTRRLRLAVMGTTAFVVPSLERLRAAGHEIVALYTQPPRPKGRGQRPAATPAQAAAERLDLPVRTPSSLRDPAEQAAFRDLGLDLAVVGAYGLILPPAILASPRLGCVNLHASLLPRWRGAAPIERAILAGDTETGVSIFQMEAGLDTGPVYAARRLTLAPAATATSVHAALADLAAGLVPEVVAGLAAGTVRAVAQPAAGVTYATKLERGEGRLDFREPASVIERRLRALNPAPGCWCEARGERLLLLAGEVVPGTGEPGTVLDLPLTIACGEGAIAVRRVQRAGRGAMSAGDLQRGFALPPGTRLG